MSAPTTSNVSEPSGDLIYQLDDRPPVLEASFAGLQHVLASFVGIVTPTLVLGGILGLQEQMPYLLSMALVVSGVGTYIQARRPFGIGAGMLCIQGTSFAFLGALISAGMIGKERGMDGDGILSLILGVCLAGSAIQIILSQFIGRLRRVITPLVTGIVITSIGMSLIKVGMTDISGGYGAADAGAIHNVLLGLFVVALIIMLNRSSNQWLRLSAIVIGLLVGSFVALSMGMINPVSAESLPLISLPLPLQYGLSFDWGAFIPVALIYVVTTIETTGDITANCVISKQPVSGPIYLQRIKCGVLGDGVNSALAALFNTFPNSTFSQNNGVIQLTGIASRHVALFIGAILVVLGLFPIVGHLLQQIPKPVLGGATLVMFGTVAAAGVKIMATEELNRRNMLIMAVSFGVGLGISMVPEALSQMPPLVQNVFGSAPATGGLTAIILTLILPEDNAQVTPLSAETAHSNSE